MKRLFTTLLLMCLFSGLRAQMPHDLLYMSKNQACVAFMYGHSSWNHYWENTLKRENFNMGTHTTQNVMFMGTYGITSRLNVIVSLPYVWTKTSAGNLLGQKGIQDGAVWLKYKAVSVGGFGLHGVIGGSIPVGNYVPDFLPMSIGIKCRTLAGRVIASYKHPKSGLYLSAHGTYTWRGKMNADRDAYLSNDRVYNTNQVSIPNAYDAGVRLGILKKKWQTEVWAERSSCLSGDNIRRNDMPFPTNNMQATVVGWYGKFQPKALGVNARVGYVTDGLNVGQSTSYMVGVLYLMNFKKK